MRNSTILGFSYSLTKKKRKEGRIEGRREGRNRSRELHSCKSSSEINESCESPERKNRESTT